MCFNLSCHWMQTHTHTHLYHPEALSSHANLSKKTSCLCIILSWLQSCFPSSIPSFLSFLPRCSPPPLCSPIGQEDKVTQLDSRCLSRCWITVVSAVRQPLSCLTKSCRIQRWLNLGMWLFQIPSCSDRVAYMSTKTFVPIDRSTCVMLTMLILSLIELFDQNSTTVAIFN